MEREASGEGNEGMFDGDKVEVSNMEILCKKSEEEGENMEREARGEGDEGSVDEEMVEIGDSRATQLWKTQGHGSATRSQQQSPR
ncbi:hypothetical protein Pcinc_040911 [Petrolisthes cinctipes]|uniref:Uncharacterized protein n=1 Tax=Petrolisthes cinctipes TaxID=88211 RepID=A0AAE1EHJ4_PETCI|nr:hypothetical protein Pcinc_040911 [Petrolisthes cinctipes]